MFLVLSLAQAGSDATALGRADTVVRRGRDVADRADLQAGGGERTDRRLAARTRALHEDVDLAHAVLHGAAGSSLGGHLGSERGGLARTLEADLAGRGPRDHGARGVRDRDDRVVERALDVSVPVGDVLLLLATNLRHASLGRHFSPTSELDVGGTRSQRDQRHLAFFLPATVRFGPLRVRALVLVRWPRTGRPRR